jgi:hypothetical protein
MRARHKTKVWKTEDGGRETANDDSTLRGHKFTIDDLIWQIWVAFSEEISDLGFVS